MKIKEQIILVICRIIFPILFNRLYKTQMIMDNKITLYNIITREWIDYHVRI